VTDSTNELLTVIVPCFNEAPTVNETVSDVFGLAPELPINVEILLIDDGSTDNTRERILGLQAKHENVKILLNDRNLGLGRSLLKAYGQLPSTSWATVIPGDNEFRFESIQNFLPLRHEYDIIMGYLKNPVCRPLARRLASDIFTELGNLLYGFDFRYFNGMKLYRISAFQGLDIEATGHAFNPELIAKAMLRDPELSIGEAPFLTRGRKEGESNAFQLDAIFESALEFYRGFQSVRQYREKVINTD
jgi:glycosyltransferase involved in cell wall biosynthesis